MASLDDKVGNHINDDVAFSILSKLLESLLSDLLVHLNHEHLFENLNLTTMFYNNFISKHHLFTMITIIAYCICFLVKCLRIRSS